VQGYNAQAVVTEQQLVWPSKTGLTGNPASAASPPRRGATGCARRCSPSCKASRARLATPSASRTRSAGRRGSALAPRVPPRGGRNARPMSRGPSGPTRGQAGAPAAARRPPDPRTPSVAAARRTDLDAGDGRAGWYPRRVRASAERGRVQGPGRAEADSAPGPSPLPAIPAANRTCPYCGCGAIPEPAAAPLDGSLNPLDGPSGVGGSGGRPWSVCTGQILCPATLRRSPSGKFRIRRGWASFVGPPQAKS
jgi:hypothetical protein